MSDDGTSALKRPKRRRVAMAVMIAAVIAIVACAIGYAVRQHDHRVRKGQQVKTVLGNLRNIDTAIDQYKSLTGKFPASLDDIIGPHKFVRSLHYVTGEDYRTVDVSGADLLRVTLVDGTEVVYSRTTHTGVIPVR